MQCRVVCVRGKLMSRLQTADVKRLPAPSAAKRSRPRVAWAFVPNVRLEHIPDTRASTAIGIAFQKRLFHCYLEHIFDHLGRASPSDHCLSGLLKWHCSKSIDRNNILLKPNQPDDSRTWQFPQHVATDQRVRELTPTREINCGQQVFSLVIGQTMRRVSLRFSRDFNYTLTTSLPISQRRNVCHSIRHKSAFRCKILFDELIKESF